MTERRGRSGLHLAWLALVAISAAAACSPTPSPPASAAPTAVVTPASSAAASAPDPTAEPTVVETPSPTVPSTAAACTTGNLKASHAIVEGAAGSRFTEVLLTSDIACSIDAFPVVHLRDANGGALVGSVAAGTGRLDLVAGAVYTSNVGLSNWCAPEPAFPLALALALGADEVPVTGSSFPLEGDLPDCNGGGGPVLQGSSWIAAP